MGKIKPMRRIPNWETDPIAVICAPVSGLLITRLSPWYTIKSIELKTGMQKMKPAGERLRANASVAKSRAKAKAAK